MRNLLIIAVAFSLLSCSNVYKSTQKAFIGTWHLSSTTLNFADKGVIIYSPDGHMTAMLSKNDTLTYGYSGKYEINTKKSVVTHFRDYYSTLPFPKSDQGPLYIREYSFSEGNQVLTLKPKESSTLILVWKKVKP
ncbi:MAG: Lipocalin-like domain [Bacteroidota bacterium]|jgi:hypothetical protein